MELIDGLAVLLVIAYVAWGYFTWAALTLEKENSKLIRKLRDTEVHLERTQQVINGLVQELDKAKNPKNAAPGRRGAAFSL